MRSIFRKALYETGHDVAVHEVDMPVMSPPGSATYREGFKNIQVYERAHSPEVKRKSKKEK